MNKKCVNQTFSRGRVKLYCKDHLWAVTQAVIESGGLYTRGVLPKKTTLGVNQQWPHALRSEQKITPWVPIPYGHDSKQDCRWSTEKHNQSVLKVVYIAKWSSNQGGLKPRSDCSLPNGEQSWVIPSPRLLLSKMFLWHVIYILFAELKCHNVTNI